MRLFARIAEARSLSAAGRLIGLSQPSASRQLKQLEMLLGVQLVQRSTHDTVLTDAGERFLASATDLLSGWEAAVETARSGRDDLRGPIRVAAPVALGQTILAQIAARFVVRHPGIAIDWRLIDEPGDLAAGGYDLWIRAGAIRDQSLIVRDLWRIDRAVVASAGHPRARDPSELVDRPAVQLVTYVPTQVLLETVDGRTTTLQLRPSFVTDNIYAAVVAVREGVGYGILPYWAVEADLATGAMALVCSDWRPPAVVLSVAYPQARFRPARVIRFLDFLRDELTRSGPNIASASILSG